MLLIFKCFLNYNNRTNSVVDLFIGIYRKTIHVKLCCFNRVFSFTSAVMIDMRYHDLPDWTETVRNELGHHIVACEEFYVHNNIVIYLESRKTVPDELLHPAYMQLNVAWKDHPLKFECT